MCICQHVLDQHFPTTHSLANQCRLCPCKAFCNNNLDFTTFVADFPYGDTLDAAPAVLQIAAVAEFNAEYYRVPGVSWPIVKAHDRSKPVVAGYHNPKGCAVCDARAKKDIPEDRPTIY